MRSVQHGEGECTTMKRSSKLLISTLSILLFVASVTLWIHSIAHHGALGAFHSAGAGAQSTSMGCSILWGSGEFQFKYIRASGIFWSYYIEHNARWEAG